MNDSIKIRPPEKRKRLSNDEQSRLGEAAWMVEEQQPAVDLDRVQAAKSRSNTEPESEPEPSEPQGKAISDFPAALLGEEPQEEDKPSALDIKRLVIGVWNRKWLVIGISVVITSLALAFAIWGVNKTWTARSVLIKKEKLDQFQVGNGLNPYRPQQYSFETMLGTLKLPTVLERTLSRTGVETLPLIFSRQVRVARTRDSNLFEVYVEWDSPELAAKLANNLSAVFIDYNRSMRSDEAAQAYDYFSKKLAEVEAKAGVLDDQIQKYRKEKNIIDIQKQGEAWIQNINALELEERAMAAEVQEMVKTKAKLETLFEAEPEMKIGTTLYRNPLKIKRASLEVKLEEIRGRYTDENPKVIELIDQLESVNRLIDEGGDSATPENTYRENPMRASLQLKLLEHEDNLAVKVALYESIAKSLEDARTNLKEFTDTRERFNALVDERASFSEILNDLRNRVEEVSVVMQGAQSDFEVIEPAIPPTDSNPTTKRLIAIAGVVLGGGAGLFVALLLEFFDARLRTRRETVGLSGAAHVFEIHQAPEDSNYACSLRDPDSDMALIIRRILNELESTLEGGLPGLVSVSSIGRGVGRSTLVENLAIVSTQKGFSTLAVDADLGQTEGRRPFVSDQEQYGLADLLSGGRSLDEVLHSTSAKRLKYIPAGRSQGRGRTGMLRLSSNRMSNLIKQFKHSSSRVFIDLPPVDEYEQVFELLQYIGAVVLVARSGETDRSKFQSYCARLERAGVNIIAVILTDVPDIYTEQPKQFYGQS